MFNGSTGLIIAYTPADDAVLAELVASPVGVAGIVSFGFTTVVIALTGAPSLARGILGDGSLISASEKTTVVID